MAEIIKGYRINIEQLGSSVIYSQYLDQLPPAKLEAIIKAVNDIGKETK